MAKKKTPAKRGAKPKVRLDITPDGVEVPVPVPTGPPRIRNAVSEIEKERRTTVAKRRAAKLLEEKAAKLLGKKVTPIVEAEEAIAAATLEKLNSKLQRAEDRFKQEDAKYEALKRIEGAFEDTQPHIVLDSDYNHLPDDLRGLVEEQQEVVFKPNPGPQTDFLAAEEREVLFGGAAGGGKSMAMLIDPLRYVGNGNFRGILFRKTNDELRELIWKSKELYPKAFAGSKFSEQKSSWRFPSGAELWLTYLDRDDDVTRYQGQSFVWVGFDELTHWSTPFAWDYMRSRLRSVDPTLPLYMRASCNPGGVGASWVRKMFIDPEVWGKPFVATDIETGDPMVYPKGHIKEGQPLFYRRFIPSKLSDNPYLFNDGQYEANLLALPEAQRRQLLDGDWDVAEGAFFPEFNRKIHVVEPFTIPASWARFRGADWGYTAPGCVLWFAVDPADNSLIVYREFYHKKLDAEQVAQQIIEIEKDEHISYGILDVSAWTKRGELGPSIGETLNKFNLRYRPSGRSGTASTGGPRSSRKSGWMEIRRRLKVDPDTGRPGLIIFNNCVNLIRTLPMLPTDKNDPEDLDTDSEDHAADALRYGCMSRPYLLEPAVPMWKKPYVPSYRPASNTFGY